MPATVTLSTTTLAAPVAAGDDRIKVASTTGITTGTRLYLRDGKELVSVVSVGPDTWVKVIRGFDGTKAVDHRGGTTVFIGRADQFYASNPVGRPPVAIPVSPRINVTEGRVWFARGDVEPVAHPNRWWQEQAVTYSTGALGVLVETLDPTTST